jgi:hypothetical protein
MRSFLLFVLLAGCSEAHTAPTPAVVHDAAPSAPRALPPAPPPPRVATPARVKRPRKQPTRVVRIPIAAQPDFVLPTPPPPPPTDLDAPLPR